MPPDPARSRRRDRAVLAVSWLLIALAVMLVGMWGHSWIKGWFVNRVVVVLDTRDGIEYLGHQRAVSSERGQVWVTENKSGELFQSGR